MAISQRRLTLDEFLKLPEEKPALEYHDGAVTQKVSPQAYHGRTQVWLAGHVNQYGVVRKMAIAFTETRSTFGGSSFVPDIGVLRWERIPRQPNGKIARDFIVPWDIAIEIASPGQTQRELLARCRWYIEHGVEIALLVDPDAETITRLGADGDPVVLRGDERVDLGSVLPGFELTPAALFASLYPD